MNLRRSNLNSVLLEPQICANIVELICGQHQNAFNDSRMPVVSTHEPGGTSVKVTLVTVLIRASDSQSVRLERHSLGTTCATRSVCHV